MLALATLASAPAFAADEADWRCQPTRAQSGFAGPSERRGRGTLSGSDQKGDACIDENIKADLFAKRKMRTTRDRLFQQTNRHEITVQGGYYVSDLFDGTYTFGAAYAYHMTEDLAVEAQGNYTRLTSSGGPELERTFELLQGKPRRQLSFDADLIGCPRTRRCGSAARSRTSICTSRSAAASSTRRCRAISRATAASA